MRRINLMGKSISDSYDELIASCFKLEGEDVTAEEVSLVLKDGKLGKLKLHDVANIIDYRVTLDFMELVCFDQDLVVNEHIVLSLSYNLHRSRFAVGTAVVDRYLGDINKVLFDLKDIITDAKKIKNPFVAAEKIYTEIIANDIFAERYKSTAYLVMNLYLLSTVGEMVVLSLTDDEQDLVSWIVEQEVAS